MCCEQNIIGGILFYLFLKQQGGTNASSFSVVEKVLKTFTWVKVSIQQCKIKKKNILDNFASLGLEELFEWDVSLEGKCLFIVTACNSYTSET